jgi:hypothetical protein
LHFYGTAANTFIIYWLKPIPAQTAVSSECWAGRVVAAVAAAVVAAAAAVGVEGAGSGGTADPQLFQCPGTLREPAASEKEQGRGLQRDVVYLGWPIAPSYMSPNAEGRGELQDLSQWVQLYTGAQINIGDLIPYLTYGTRLHGFPLKRTPLVWRFCRPNYIF